MPDRKPGARIFVRSTSFADVYCSGSETCGAGFLQGAAKKLLRKRKNESWAESPRDSWGIQVRLSELEDLV